MSAKREKMNLLQKILLCFLTIFAIFVALFLFITKAKFNLCAYFWLFACLALFIVEIFTPGFFVLPFSGGCLFATFFSLLRFSLTAQILIFIGVSIFFWYILHTFVSQKTFKKLNGDEIIGAKGVVTVEIIPPKKGRVYLLGNTWVASANEPIENGKNVVVKSIEGITVFVEEDLQ